MINNGSQALTLRLLSLTLERFVRAETPTAFLTP